MFAFVVCWVGVLFIYGLTCLFWFAGYLRFDLDLMLLVYYTRIPLIFGLFMVNCLCFVVYECAVLEFDLI